MWDTLQNAGRMVGQILAVGPQAFKAHAAALVDLVDERDPALEPWCAAGDWVLYSRHAGKFIFDPMREAGEEKELYVINDDDIIAVLPPIAEWKIDLRDIVGY